MFPIHVWAKYSGSNPDNYTPLGTQPDIRTMSMEGDLQPGDEFTIGPDTWVAFPVANKRVTFVADDTEQSGLLGVAYKKVTT